MNIVTEEKNQRIASACFLILVGILMCFFTTLTASVFALVCGIVCLVFGCLFIAAYFMTLLIHEPYLLLRGLFLLFLGSAILAYPGDFLYVMVFTASFYLIYLGIEEMAYAIDLAKMHVRNWWIDLVGCILTLGCGIAILAVHFSGGNSIGFIVSLAGAFLIAEGVFELVMILALHRDYKRAFKSLSH
jgi:uncharacterized membrane protein HdeD (DUF308 family)